MFPPSSTYNRHQIYCCIYVYIPIYNYRKRALLKAQNHWIFFTKGNNFCLFVLMSSIPNIIHVISYTESYASIGHEVIRLFFTKGNNSVINVVCGISFWCHYHVYQIHVLAIASYLKCEGSYIYYGHKIIRFFPEPSNVYIWHILSLCYYHQFQILSFGQNWERICGA